MEQEGYICSLRLHSAITSLWRGVKVLLVLIVLAYNSYVLCSTCQRDRSVSEQCEQEHSAYPEKPSQFTDLEYGNLESPGFMYHSGLYWSGDEVLYGKDQFQICAIECCSEGETFDSIENPICTATTFPEDI
ncbi:hypothetical protein J6590_054050 [Homalodisca vitripennis]|nr:hypothetical protein J6590_054050 [Homalodisca vitripennis]